jgi:hypothetical protein
LRLDVGRGGELCARAAPSLADRRVDGAELDPVDRPGVAHHRIVKARLLLRTGRVERTAAQTSELFNRPVGRPIGLESGVCILTTGRL